MLMLLVPAPDAEHSCSTILSQWNLLAFCIIKCISNSTVSQKVEEKRACSNKCVRPLRKMRFSSECYILRSPLEIGIYPLIHRGNVVTLKPAFRQWVEFEHVVFWEQVEYVLISTKKLNNFLVEKGRNFEKHDSCHQIPAMLLCRIGIKFRHCSLRTKPEIWGRGGLNFQYKKVVYNN